MFAIRFNRGLAALILLVTFSITACESSEMQNKTTSESPTEGIDWQKIASKRIYFGHQSVGNNILAGVRLLAKESGHELNIVQGTDPAQLNRPAILHSPVGENEKPNTKNESFARVMTHELRGKPEVAFYKYCYVDVKRDTNPEQLFADYKKTVDTVLAANPQLTMVHITTPLTVNQTGPKAWLKQVLGKPVAGLRENQVRARFNELLYKEYGGKAPIFDLAKYESTREDGSRSSYEVDGKTYYSLAPEYSDDGGHLNERGQRFVAAHFLRFLSQLPDTAKPVAVGAR